jgi:hypothetical protein
VQRHHISWYYPLQIYRKKELHLRLIGSYRRRKSEGHEFRITRVGGKKIGFLGTSIGICAVNVGIETAKLIPLSLLFGIWAETEPSSFSPPRPLKAMAWLASSITKKVKKY